MTITGAEQMHQMLIDRFMEKVSVNEETGCWDWIGSKNKAGYGKFSVCGGPRLSHRVSYELHRGSAPAKMQVCHRCDVPGCVNPGHLFLGTPTDNVADMISKGRQAKSDKTVHLGEDHGCAKLTEADVLSIRAAVGISQRTLAKLYGVGQSQIQRIRAGESWNHVDTGANQGTFASM